MPLAPASHHPSTLNLVATLGISYSGLLGHLDQPMPFFELNSLPFNHELPDSSELFCPVEAMVNHHLVDLHLQVSYTYLSLDFYFNHNKVALEAWAVISRNWPRRSTRAPSISWKCKTNMAAMPSARTCRSHLKMTGVITQDAMETTLLMEKSLDQALLHLQDLDSPRADSTSDFLERHILDEQVKLTKKMGNHLDQPPQAGWSPSQTGWESLPKVHPPTQLGASEAQRPLRSIP